MSETSQHYAASPLFNGLAPRRIASRLKRLVGIAYNRAEALLFDLRYGTDTRGKAAAADMGLSGAGAEHATGYQGVNEFHFRDVAARYAFPRGSTFVDVGSGKGKALLLATGIANVGHVVGVEIAADLCKIAERNVERYRQHANGVPVTVIAGDAIEVPIEPDQNIFFLNNPFDRQFLALFLRKIDASLATHPRKVWLIYGNPQARDLIVDGFGYSFIREHRFFGPGRNIAVYEKSLSN
jgi:predicted RNA methylase